MRVIGNLKPDASGLRSHRAQLYPTFKHSYSNADGAYVASCGGGVSHGGLLKLREHLLMAALQMHQSGKLDGIGPIVKAKRQHKCLFRQERQNYDLPIIFCSPSTHT